jgi:hypothetical protein
MSGFGTGISLQNWNNYGGILEDLAGLRAPSGCGRGGQLSIYDVHSWSQHAFVLAIIAEPTIEQPKN